MKSLLAIIFALVIALSGFSGCAYVNDFINGDSTEITDNQGNDNGEDDADTGDNQTRGPGIVDSITNGGSFDGGNYD